MKSACYIFFLLLVAGFHISACTKFGKNITVKGRVINPNTNEGIQGATIVISNDPGSPLYWMLSKRTKETSTAADGSFEMDALRVKTYYVYAYAPDGYTALGWYENGSYSERKVITKGTKMVLEYHMVP